MLTDLYECMNGFICVTKRFFYSKSTRQKLLHFNVKEKNEFVPNILNFQIMQIKLYNFNQNLKLIKHIFVQSF